MGLKEKALANFELAQELRDEHKFDAAANRLYYAVFQAVCFYAEKKLDYQWRGKEATAKLSSGEVVSGSAHQVIRLIVRNELHSKLNAFRLLLDLRKIADYEEDIIGEYDLSRDLILDAQTLKESFLKKGG